MAQIAYTTASAAAAAVSLHACMYVYSLDFLDWHISFHMVYMSLHGNSVKSFIKLTQKLI